jgi:SAM-dependent methyltransferase
MDMVRPQSVVDVGCGVGTWLAEFQARGVSDILGIDGDYVDRSMLQIAVDTFSPQNLSNGALSSRKFDLAISLEVAEHLPAESAGAFVRSLTALAPVVAFSAAIPHQGGTDHINERWQSYWAELFRQLGYEAYDPIRPRIWTDTDVEVHYRQNLIIYAIPVGAPSERIATAHSSRPAPTDVVHPSAFFGLAESHAQKNWGVRRSMGQLGRSAVQAVRKRFGGPTERKA